MDQSEARTAPLVQPDHGHHVGWKSAGIILFTFAAPSAVMAVPFAIANAGYAGGMILCIILTWASVAGANMLLEMKLLYPHCETLGDLGKEVIGRWTQIWGNVIQLGNFCLFMPCALSFVAQSLYSIGTLGPLGDCIDYYVWVVAGICLLSTQVRSFDNVNVFTTIAFLCSIGMVVTMVVGAFQYEHTPRIPAQWFGNPEPDPGLRLIRLASGFTINAWAFIPAFLTVELSTCMPNPVDFKKSLLLAGGLNVVLFVIVGSIVVVRWGYNVGEVIAITAGVGAFVPGNVINTLFNAFQLGGNFVCYMLDSVPLARFCQETWAPNFKDTWTMPDILRYLGYTLPTFFVALLLSTFAPSIDTLVDFVTALTIPWVTQIYPAVLYWKFLHGRAADNIECGLEDPIKKSEKITVALVFTVGCISFCACMLKAVGYLALDELRPSFQIGCNNWLIWKWSGN
ncbi:mtr [Symbiodinium necroappetens]|uniref:Mtr protein n=1 Tax=Symbiodinium necroappetens TaxID=1628268 RepID=A0A812UDK0_9DINO|nr:mtr [Symbiodinium necroappetens]